MSDTSKSTPKGVVARVVLIFGMLCASLIPVALATDSASAAIGGKRVAVLTPFTGGATTGSQSPAIHPIYSSGYGTSWDMHGGASAGVYPRVATNDGSVSMKVVGVSPSSYGAGTGVAVEVKVDGITVGTLNYRHLVNIPSGIVNNAAVNSGSRLGDTAPSTHIGNCYGFACSDGWDVHSVAGIHTHIEFKQACYGPLGTSTWVNSSTGIALLSQNYGTANKSSCDSAEITSVATTTVPTSSLTPRIGVLQTNGHFLVKENGLNTPWVDVLDNVAAGYVSGDRIAVVQTNGHLLVKQGDINTPWYDLLDNVASASISPGRVGVLQTNGHFLVKEGGLFGDWTDVLDNVSSGTVTDSRVGVLQTNGHYSVKEGSLSTGWSDQKDNVQSGYIAGSRIAVIQTNGHFLIKEGGLSASWTDLLDNVASASISSTRVGVLQTNGHFLVKDGGYSGGWTDVLDNVAAIKVINTQIGALQTNGHFQVKQGGISGDWTDLLDNVASGALLTE